MSFIDFGDEYNDVKESKPLPEGNHFLRIQDTTHVTENGKNYLKVILVPDDAADAEAEFGYPPAAIMHVLALPQITDDDKDTENGRDLGSTRKFKLLNIKRFMLHFKIELDGTTVDPQDFAGKTARTKVTHQDYEGRPQARLVLPQIED